MHSKDELTGMVAPRYWSAIKKEKSVILKEFCLNTGYEHKYAIKKLRNAFLYPVKNKQKRVRKKVSEYMIIKQTIKKLWDNMDFPFGNKTSCNVARSC